MKYLLLGIAVSAAMAGPAAAGALADPVVEAAVITDATVQASSSSALSIVVLAALVAFTAAASH